MKIDSISKEYDICIIMFACNLLSFFSLFILCSPLSYFIIMLTSFLVKIFTKKLLTLY